MFPFRIIIRNICLGWPLHLTVTSANSKEMNTDVKVKKTKSNRYRQYYNGKLCI